MQRSIGNDSHLDPLGDIGKRGRSLLFDDFVEREWREGFDGLEQQRLQSVHGHSGTLLGRGERQYRAAMPWLSLRVRNCRAQRDAHHLSDCGRFGKKSKKDVK